MDSFKKGMGIGAGILTINVLIGIGFLFLVFCTICTLLAIVGSQIPTN